MKKCWGETKHKKGCRPGRPACRYRRREKGICRCDRYHFPHRAGGGRCGDEDAMWSYVFGPSMMKGKNDAAEEVSV